MDKFSFLNAAHTTLFESLYEQYRTSPDRVEPSWKAFFQGFDFGAESVLEDWDLGELSNGKLNHSNNGVSVSVPESVQKEFQVVKLIDGYRSRGHLFTKTNPVRERRKYRPNLALSNFGLSESDLDTIFNAGEILGIGSSSLRIIIDHLERIYCDSIGVEYMYIRTPERIEWIQNYLNQNDNRSQFSAEKQKYILENAGVASRAFNDRCARLELARGFCSLDDAEGSAVLDRTAGVHELSLAQDRTASLFRCFAQVDQGRVANGFYKSVADGHFEFGGHAAASLCLKMFNIADH